MALIDCPECGKQVSGEARACPDCGYPINPEETSSDEPDEEHEEREEEEVILEVHPKMFRDEPGSFLLFSFLVVAGIGVAGYALINEADSQLLYGGLAAAAVAGVVLLVWWLRVTCKTLTITNKKTRVRTGVLAKNINEVAHDHVRNVKIAKGLQQRLFGVGTLKISSSGQSGIEISIKGIPEPEKVNDLITQYQQRVHVRSNDGEQ